MAVFLEAELLGQELRMLEPSGKASLAASLSLKENVSLQSLRGS